MKTSQHGVDLVKSFEGCKLHAYRDSVGVPSIGYGTIIYTDGNRVQMGDIIDQDTAEELLKWQIRLKELTVNNLIKPMIVNQNQFDALMSFTYNVGVGGLAGSGLLKKLKKNVNDPDIRSEFLKWNKGHVNGQLVVLEGLTKRRMREAELYFS